MPRTAELKIFKIKCCKEFDLTYKYYITNLHIVTCTHSCGYNAAERNNNTHS